MAVKLKANVQYINAIETIQRKFVPRKVKVVSVAAGQVAKIGPATLDTQDGFMGGAQRVSYRGGLGQCTRNFLFIKTEGRTSPLKAHELDMRTFFSRAVKGKNVILKDLSQISRVQVMWHGGDVGGTHYEGAYNDPSIRINGVSAKGYTYYGWIMAVQYAGVQNDPEHYSENTFPSAYDA